MSEECEDCGRVPPKTADEEWENKLRLIQDEFVYGNSLRCASCDTRFNPIELDKKKIVSKDDEVKFLERDNLNYGME